MRTLKMVSCFVIAFVAILIGGVASILALGGHGFWAAGMNVPATQVAGVVLPLIGAGYAWLATKV